ncbi:hypothetical protein ACSQ67_005690 [Phaseolus vulgaris]
MQGYLTGIVQSRIFKGESHSEKLIFQGINPLRFSATLFVERSWKRVISDVDRRMAVANSGDLNQFFNGDNRSSGNCERLRYGVENIVNGGFRRTTSVLLCDFRRNWSISSTTEA